MKRIKVENISVMKLDFFLQQNKQDIRVVLSPGDISWCDEGSTTKSMILYERKNLIKTSTEEIPEYEHLSIKEESEAIKERMKKSLEEFAQIKIKNPPTGLISDDLDPILPLSFPSSELFIFEPVYKPEKKDEEQNVEPTKEEKKYKGKKRGRKKKRGPKKGSKRNKGGNSESNSQE